MFGGNTPNNPPGIGNALSGNLFTSPFALSAPESKEKMAMIEPSTEGRPSHVVRPSIFGHAVGEILKSSPKKSPVPSNDVSSLQSLYVPDVPAELLDKKKLLEHFSQFGHVIRIFLHPVRKCCTLNFDSHESAEKAKNWGTIIENIRIQIFWAKPASLRRSDGRRTSTTKASSRDSHKDESEPKASIGRRSATETSSRKSSLPDDVQDELRSMMNTDASSFSERPSKPVRRPDKERRSQIKPISAPSKAKRELGLTGSRENSPGPSTISKSATMGGGDADIMIYGSAVSADELQGIMRSPAHTAEERYRVLEARDKLLRLKRVRQSNLATARINRGTCPDMCPEKERYLREYQRQVASYEHTGVPGKMEHKKAVKQYSRSSADQEEPLSHELRSAPVLRLTMDYLMWRLMDVCDKRDENMADWYHFIWDRTRGIRKDITQQELCDENSVVLVEQCVRWHIFCSERLIAEDLSVYDDNINTENLTKCLQTLKYMYQDLGLKGVTCPNEAEFRAYFVLLNLNEGDCMWEVQQLSSEIRESEPVRFALQVSAALASNNYIRFFKLVRESTYLNACILHRYFAQVRSHALITIVKAFCSRAMETVFTLDEVVRLAGLENAHEAATLCMHHGLRLTEDRSSVIMSRSSFSHPDTTLPATRVLSLVEAKRNNSVGETVNGGVQSCLAFETHIPHDSFDDRGLLKSAAWTAMDQDIENSNPEDDNTSMEQMVDMKLKAAEREEALKKAAVAKQVCEMKIVKTYTDILEQVTNDEVCSVIESCMKTALLDAASVEFMDEVLCLVTNEMISQVCGDVLKNEIEMEQKRILVERLASEAEMLRKMQEKKFLQELNNYLDEFMLDCAKQVIQDEIAFEEAQKKLAAQFIETFINEECMAIADEMIAEARSVEADAIRARIQHRQMRCYFLQWRSTAAKSKFRNQSMADFPAWMSNLSIEEQVSDLKQPDPFLIQNMNRNRFAALKSKRIALEQEPAPLPSLDIGSVVMPQLVARMKEMSNHEAFIYWKVFTSIPDSVEARQNSKLIQAWTEAIFSFRAGQLISMSQVKPSLYKTVTICVRRLIGMDVSADQSQGTSGILFWISHKESSFALASQRLSAILRSKPKLPAIPVAVILSGPFNMTNKQIQSELKLSSLREAGFVSYYKVFPRQSNTVRSLMSQMEACCEWLAELSPSQPPLMVTSLHRLMVQYLGQELWLHVKSTVHDQAPNIIVELYNSAVEKTEDLLSDNSLFDYSLGGYEFSQYIDDDALHQEQRGFQIAPENWGSSLYLPPVAKVLSSAKIPRIKPWPPQTHSDLQSTLVGYCTALAVPHVVSSVYQIIENHAKIKTSTKSPLTPTGWKEFIKTLPWSDVMQMIVEAKLHLLDYSFVSPRDSSRVELKVVVHRQKMQQLQDSMWLIGDQTLAVKQDDNTEEEKFSQKRLFVDETPKPSKQRRLSLVEALPDIKTTINSIDSNFSAVRATWAEIASKWGNRLP